MKLAAFVHGKAVGILEPIGDFKSVFTYDKDAAPHDLISLTMPVRTESYVWNDVLHPVFQMNLPEGYLLQVLQEAFGPHIGANPTALLAVIGRNMVGRLQVAPPGSSLTDVADPAEVNDILQGDNGYEAFAHLVKRHARSGVSGVLPKFLAPSLSAENKTTVLTKRHLIKGSSAALPFAALNEHFCMRVAAQVLPTAKTAVSRDGRALVVDRFDGDAGQPTHGLDDFCSLLGMRPAAKYETTWERIARATRDHVAGPQLRHALHHFASILLLSYALRNADCHAKNIALMYTHRADAYPAPVYDMLTTTVYDDYAANPPALSFMGTKTWTPGKRLQTFLTAHFDMPVRTQIRFIDAIGGAMLKVAPQVRSAMQDAPGFADIGSKMLWAWEDGLKVLSRNS